MQACYRGPRLYDTDSTLQTVKEIVSWYKKYREILNSDVIHLRRANGRDWDGILHVNPGLREKGMLVLFNPLREKISRSIKVPVYYTGLKDKARVLRRGKQGEVINIDRDYNLNLNISIEPGEYEWVLIE